MPEITLDKLHTLLEGLAEHVMNKMPTKQEMNGRFDQVEKDIQLMKLDILQTKVEVQQTKIDLQQTNADVKLILNGLDAQAKQLEIIRTEQAAFSHAIDRHEKRITALEEKDTGWRIRDKKE